MKPWIIAIALAVLGSGIALLLATRAAEPPAVPIVPEARAPSNLDVPAPVAMRRPARPVPAVAIEDEQAGSADVPSTHDRAEPEAVPTVEEMRDRIETAFVAEPAGASRDLAQGIEAGVRAVLPAGSSVRSVECRNSLCRIETVHPGLDEFRDFTQRAFRESAWVSNGPVFVSLLEEPTPRGPVVAVAYVGREGTVLPMRDPGAAADRP